MTKHGVMSLTTNRVRAGTQLTLSLHQRNAAKGEIGMNEICAMSSAAKMHANGSKPSVRSASALNRSDVKRGTMTTMVPIVTNLTDIVLLKEGAMQEESRTFPMT
jgi:hypothetical protein